MRLLAQPDRSCCRCPAALARTAQAPAPDLAAASAIRDAALAEGRTTLTEHEAKALLRAFGVRVPPSPVVTTREAARRGGARDRLSGGAQDPLAGHHAQDGSRRRAPEPAGRGDGRRRLRRHAAQRPRRAPGRAHRGRGGAADAALRARARSAGRRRHRPGVRPGDLVRHRRHRGRGGARHRDRAAAAQRRARARADRPHARQPPAGRLPRRARRRPRGAGRSCCCGVSEMVCALPWLQRNGPQSRDRASGRRGDRRCAHGHRPVAPAGAAALRPHGDPSVSRRNWRANCSCATARRSRCGRSARRTRSSSGGSSTGFPSARATSGSSTRWRTCRRRCWRASRNWTTTASWRWWRSRPAAANSSASGAIAPNADGETAEFALTVADAWQGRGVGRALLERALRLRARGGLPHPVRTHPECEPGHARASPSAWASCSRTATPIS